MYFFNSVDRSNLGNAKTDGMDVDLGFTGEQYSLLILLFYLPNGLFDLPLNMLTMKWSGRVMLPSCECASELLKGLGEDVVLMLGSDAGLGCDGAVSVCCNELRGYAGYSPFAWCF